MPYLGHLPTMPPSPDTRELLLPLLSCLPAAFLSARPPPALMPLLSPILRQRISLWADSHAHQSTSELLESNWVKLLTWHPQRATNLSEVISRIQLEPHPVSGELELFGDDDDEDEAGKPTYRRPDSETLHARCVIKEHNLVVIWLWCENDTGGTGIEALTGGEAPSAAQDGWKVAEVTPFDDQGEVLQWYDTVTQADQALSAQDNIPVERKSSVQLNGRPIDDSLDDGDDDYWAAYDRTPGRTPARTPAKLSPTPGAPSSYFTARDLRRSTPGTAAAASEAAEDDYYARYGDVQPALDSHDPDEAIEALGVESTLEPGHEQTSIQLRSQTQAQTGTKSMDQELPVLAPTPLASIHEEHEHGHEYESGVLTKADAPEIVSPTPSRPSSASSNPAVERMEHSAQSSSAAEVGVRQHIGHEIKSLYRLARGIGMERQEFERMVRRELEVLSMLEADD